MKKNFYLIFCICLSVLISTKAQCSDKVKKNSGKLVGVAYSTWHQSENWENVWGKPKLGFYRSDDGKVICQHGKWLTEAGVNFIFVDWSNDINYDPSVPHKKNVFDMIESATNVIFKEFYEMKKSPKICIMAGVTGSPDAVKDGRLQKKTDQIYNQYIANPTYRKLYQYYLGKPLLIIYVNTPSPFQNGIPKWSDPRFTVRWMTGYIAQQHNLVDNKNVSKYGYWSWEERGKQTYTIYNGKPEEMTIVAAWRADNGKGEPQPRQAVPEQGRLNGLTFRRQWNRADSIGVKIALVVSWNEWSRGEQPSAEISKDIEPSENFGYFYLDLLQKEIQKFRSLK